jgi:hypothetical protein
VRYDIALTIYSRKLDAGLLWGCLGANLPRAEFVRGLVERAPRTVPTMLVRRPRCFMPRFMEASVSGIRSHG